MSSRQETGPRAARARPVGDGAWLAVCHLACMFKSSGLRSQPSALQRCTLILCWDHDWPDCPLEVIELRTTIHELPLAQALAPIPGQLAYPSVDPTAVPRMTDLQDLRHTLARQPSHAQALFRTVDERIRGRSEVITARATRGRYDAGGVSHYSPKGVLLCFDFRKTGQGLTLTMFTRGQPLEGIYCGLHLLVRCHSASLTHMAAYSIDLRQKLVSASERRLGSQRALADVFGVRRSFVEKVLRRDRTPGELGPKPHGGGQKPHVDAAARALLRQVVHDHPDATLEELCAGLADTTGVRVSLATMCRVVQRLALPRTKNRSMRRSATRPASSRRGRTTAS